MGGLAPYAAGKLVSHYDTHVPFLLAAVVVLAGIVVLYSLRRALNDADRAGDTVEGEDAVRRIPADPEEAILVEEALARERRT